MKDRPENIDEKCALSVIFYESENVSETSDEDNFAASIKYIAKFK